MQALPATAPIVGSPAQQRHYPNGGYTKSASLTPFITDYFNKHISNRLVTKTLRRRNDGQFGNSKLRQTQSDLFI